MISPAADAPAAAPPAAWHRPRTEGPAAPGLVPAPAVSGAPRPALDARACARWAGAEGLKAGDTVALLVRDAGEAGVLRLGLALAGVRAVSLDVALRGEDLGRRLAASGAAVAIVDTGLAEAYAGVMGRIETYPAVWWNGTDADFARLDLALAEHGAPLPGEADATR